MRGRTARRPPQGRTGKRRRPGAAMATVMVREDRRLIVAVQVALFRRQLRWTRPAATGAAAGASPDAVAPSARRSPSCHRRDDPGRCWTRDGGDRRGGSPG